MLESNQRARLTSVAFSRCLTGVLFFETHVGAIAATLSHWFLASDFSNWEEPMLISPLVVCSRLLRSFSRVGRADKAEGCEFVIVLSPEDLPQ